MPLFGGLYEIWTGFEVEAPGVAEAERLVVALVELRVDDGKAVSESASLTGGVLDDEATFAFLGDSSLRSRIAEDERSRAEEAAALKD